MGDIPSIDTLLSTREAPTQKAQQHSYPFAWADVWEFHPPMFGHRDLTYLDGAFFIGRRYDDRRAALSTDIPTYSAACKVWEMMPSRQDAPLTVFYRPTDEEAADYRHDQEAQEELTVTYHIVRRIRQSEPGGPLHDDSLYFLDLGQAKAALKAMAAKGPVLGMTTRSRQFTPEEAAECARFRKAIYSRLWRPVETPYLKAISASHDRPRSYRKRVAKNLLIGRQTPLMRRKKCLPPKADGLVSLRAYREGFQTHINLHAIGEEQEEIL